MIPFELGTSMPRFQLETDDAPAQRKEPETWMRELDQRSGVPAYTEPCE